MGATAAVTPSVERTLITVWKLTLEPARACAKCTVDGSFTKQLRVTSAMTNASPTLLTLPIELRSAIFNLTLLNTPIIRADDPPYQFHLDLSLLSTNRQVYFETRTIPIALHYFSKQFDPEINFLSSLNLRPFQIAALRTLDIEYLSPNHLPQFLALGSDNGYLFGEQTLDLDLLVICADDWIADGARRWRYPASPEDIYYNLPKSGRWLRALCALKGWKQLEVAFKTRELVAEHWKFGGFMQTLFDDFRSHSGDLDEDFTIWHESHEIGYEKITVFRTKDLGRFKRPQWWRKDLEKLREARECVSGEPLENEGERPTLHVQERCGGPVTRQSYCARCQARRPLDCKDYESQPNGFSFVHLGFL